METDINTAIKQKLIKLSANENFYGCPPAALEAIKRNYQKVSFYPDYTQNALEKKIASFIGVDAGNIVAGAGSVRLIDGIIQSFVNDGEEILTFEKSFIAYSELAAIHRKKCSFAKQTDFVCNPDNLLHLLNEKTKVVFIANPNNPTGTIITHTQLENLLKNISEKIFVVIDEAYFEYVTAQNYPDSLNLLQKFSNLIILRTFSKIYGLAGLRIGYAVANEKIISELIKSRIPYSLNFLAAEAAMAALDDREFVKRCAQANDTERKFLYDAFCKAGFQPIPSQANFLYLHFETECQKENVLRKLADEGLLVCNLKIFGQDKSLRITVGDRETNEKVMGCIT